MKYVAIILAMVLVGCMIVTVVVFLSSDVTITPAERPITVRAAADRPDLFAEVTGTSGSGITADEIGDYKFLTWKVEVHNRAFLPLEMVEATIVTRAGDVARTDQSAGIRVAPGEDGTLAVTVLTRNEVPAGRDITVSWYMWGKAYQKTLTLR